MINDQNLIHTPVICVLSGSHPALGNQHIHHSGYQVVSTSFLVERRLQIFTLILSQAQVILVQSALDYQLGSLNLRRIKILQQLNRYTGTVILVYMFTSLINVLLFFFFLYSLSIYWTLKIKSERIFWLYVGCDLKDKRKLDVVLLHYWLMSINRLY